MPTLRIEPATEPLAGLVIICKDCDCYLDKVLEHLEHNIELRPVEYPCFGALVSQVVNEYKTLEGNLEHINDFGESECGPIVVKHSNERLRNFLLEHGISAGQYNRELEKRISYRSIYFGHLSIDEDLLPN